MFKRRFKDHVYTVSKSSSFYIVYYIALQYAWCFMKDLSIKTNNILLYGEVIYLKFDKNNISEVILMNLYP